MQTIKKKESYMSGSGSEWLRLTQVVFIGKFAVRGLP